MAVPMEVFDRRVAPFVTMTAGMLAAVVLALSAMMLVLFRYMKRSVQAQAEASARTEFLSNMSHEIRTPLNGIIGLNHLMERHLGDEAAMEGYVRKLGKSVNYLLSLVNDILDVSKLQAGKVELAEAPFNLAAAIGDVCDMQREAMDEKGIRFHLHRSLPHPWLVGDEVRISQVFVNILSNAVKFTPEGGSITFEASQAEGPDGKVRCDIAISDTGCGMTAEFQKRIFDTFSQERHTTSESQKGTGLGMAISQLLTCQMGGTISVESEVGKGSRFSVSIPLAVAPAGVVRLQEAGAAAVAQALEAGDGRLDEGAAPQVEKAPAGDRPFAVLVAEDNELNTEILTSILSEEGYAVTAAENGQAALEAFAASSEGHFLAVLMDAQMPVMDGYDAARAIRALPRPDAAAVTIFACTASTFAEDRARALEAGMDDFLAKPLNVPVMLQKLGALREGGRHEQ